MLKSFTLTMFDRLNYILWLQDVVRVHERYIDRPGGGDTFGIDIGTGASAIYPLLGCRVDAGWKFIATELDETSYSYANRNVEANGLSEKIHLVKTSSEGRILSVMGSYPTISFEFTMCNPPFYESGDEMTRSAASKELPPNAVCTGAEVEMITPGGELGFVGRIVRESLDYKERCRWYTSMLGKLTSAVELVKLLRENSVTNYAITEFVQGETRRWAIAWSFGDIHLPDSIVGVSNPTLRSYMPPQNTISCKTITPFESISETISHIAGVTVDKRPDGSLTVYASQNTWSRAVRRRLLRGEEAALPTPSPNSLICGISFQGGGVVFEWILGQDRSLFESFVNHVTRTSIVCNNI